MKQAAVHASAFLVEVLEAVGLVVVDVAFFSCILGLLYVHLLSWLVHNSDLRQQMLVFHPLAYLEVYSNNHATL